MILVTGAAGKTGTTIIKKLVNLNKGIRAWIYKDSYKEKLQKFGVTDFVIGDLLDESLWKKAVYNIESVYHICPNMNPNEFKIGQLAISSCSSSTTIKRFVFHSVLHPQIKKMPHHWNKLLVEELLIESNLDWTIIQPTAYMQNILSSWDDIIKNNYYSVPYPVNTKISLVDLNDVAEVSSKVLTENNHSYAIYELVGEPSLTQIDIANILSKKFNQTIAVKELLLDDWKERMKSANMRVEQINTLVSMFKHYKNFNLSGNSNVLKMLLNREPTSFNEYISELTN
jgi:NAD(P)H dehydrogenase (quinone)